MTEIIQLKNSAQAQGPFWLVLGKIVAVYIATWLLPDGVYDTAAAGPILRAGGKAEYFTIRHAHKFSMPRPRL